MFKYVVTLYAGLSSFEEAIPTYVVHVESTIELTNQEAFAKAVKLTGRSVNFIYTVERVDEFLEEEKL